MKLANNDKLYLEVGYRSPPRLHVSRGRTNRGGWTLLIWVHFQIAFAPAKYWRVSDKEQP